MTVAAAGFVSVEELVEAARTRTGAGSNESFEHLDALEALTSAIAGEARLTPSGVQVAANALVSALAVQVAVRRSLERHPEIAAGPDARLVFVTGLPRTGTTLVHNLLARHPAVHCPRLWELMAPAGSRDVREHARLAAQAQAWLDEFYAIAPRLPAIHPMGAHRPDECHRLLGHAFQSMIYPTRYRVPSYSAWLRERDMRAAYEFHRVQLASIMWRAPAEVAGLKCPFHLWHLGALRTVYPEAKVVMLHRDLTAVVPSLCSLSSVIRAARSDDVDKREVGAFWLSEVEHAAADLLLRRELPSNEGVLDVRYVDLTSDTIGTMQRVFEFIDVPPSHATEKSIRRWIAENPADKHGRHRYTPEEFGLDPSELAERFAAYRAAYAV